MTKTGRMNEAEYLATQAQLLMLASLVREINVEDFLKCIESSEATAPVLDPILWLRARAKMEEIKKIALGAQAFKNSLPRETRSNEGGEDVHGQIPCRRSP